MAILREHIPYYQEILSCKGFLQDPILVFGYQDCLMAQRAPVLSRGARWARLWLTAWRSGLPGALKCRPIRNIPAPFNCPTLQDILHAYGGKNVQTLDAFDARADIRHDMNLPLGEGFSERYRTIIDIGSLEHVFDTRQCLANLFKMLKVGGHILLHVPCNGYCDHGFHTFSPACITGALECNGFAIQYLKFSSRDGFELADPAISANSLLWVVAQKNAELTEFVVPQQKGWTNLYKGEQ